MGRIVENDYGVSWTGPVVLEKRGRVAYSSKSYTFEGDVPTLDELTRKPRKPRVPYIGRYHVHDSADMAGTLRGFEEFEPAWRLVEQLLAEGKRPVMRDCKPKGLGRIYPTPGECGPTGTGGKRVSTHKQTGSELHGKVQRGFNVAYSDDLT